MNDIKEYTIRSPEEMIALWKVFVESGYKKFGLKGELGAGKTHFTKWVAQWLGLDPNKVHSPTYVYFLEYHSSIVSEFDSNSITMPLWNHEAIKLLHVDMYRITDPHLLIKSGLQDKLDDYIYRCIERPKYPWIHDRDEMIHINIEIVDEITRKVSVWKPHLMMNADEYAHN